MSSPMDKPIAILCAADAEQDERVLWIRETFKTTNGKEPHFIAKAPGRVNIIGEHIDYAHFGCLPAAIDRNVMMACSVEVSSTDKSTVKISNTESKKFPSDEFSWNANDPNDLTLDKSAHSWSNYFKAGVKSVLGHLPESNAKKALSFTVLVDGNVPPGGGLSSSAAMVVASALATLQGYSAVQHFSQGDLARLTLEIEALVGVQTGGMDQCASILSEVDALLNVEFFPTLRASVVKFPKTQKPLSYVICNTRVTSEKQKTAKFNYNLRVVELRVAARLLAMHLKVNPTTPLPTLKQVMEAHYQQPAKDVREEIERLDEMLQVSEKLFGKEKDGTSWEAVYEGLQTTKGAFAEKYHGEFEIEASHLKLYKRSKHAFSEAKRVFQYRALMEDAESADDSLPTELGNLMNESQSSCHNLYECSCPEIEEVCEISRKAGSLGSRLTGAGGGCTVHLVSAEKQAALIDALRQRYFAERFPDLSEAQLQESLFATTPQRGACLYALG